MSRARSMTPLQLTEAISRDRDGRPDLAAMTDGERRAAGCMTLKEAVEWERLPIVPYARAAERVHGPVADDIWAVNPDGA